MSRKTRMNMPITDSHEEETMHLFDAEAWEEEALCGAETSVNDRISLQYYVERRRYDLAVGTVCERCKPRAVALPCVFAGNSWPKDGWTRPKSTDDWPTD